MKPTGGGLSASLPQAWQEHPTGHAGLAGLNAAWSRLVTAADADGVTRTWHVLDSWAARTEDAERENPTPEITLLCVHGNPTWSYLWRRVLANAPPSWRVLAPDHLDMGFSERTGTKRRLARRIDDLERVVAELGLTGPVVVVAHDWGGPISLGWALGNRARLAGLVLTNTAVTQPPGSPAPRIIRAVRNAGLLRQIAVKSTGFVRGALAMAAPAVTSEERAGFLAPYRSADRREAIGFFVEDIPLEPSHPTHQALDEVAEGIRELSVPTLLMWGPSDPVFSDPYLEDLAERIPHAEVHRFVGSSHLVTEHPDAVPGILDFVAGAISNSTPASEQPASAQPASDELASNKPKVVAVADAGSEPREGVGQAGGLGPDIWSALVSRRHDDASAVVEMPDERSVSFRELADDVEHLAAGFAALGVQHGTRVALLVPPGIDLVRALYGCWRAGAVVVVVDAGLGPKGIGRALKSAAPDYIVGIERALGGARALGWPGQRILVESQASAETKAVGAAASIARRAVGATTTLEAIRSDGAGRPIPEPPGPEDNALVVFTSGATGPAKGVRYRHHQMVAQRDALIGCYNITSSDRLVAAFAPFALYGPAMGIPSVVPDCDVTAPGTLRADTLADAAGAIGATLLFASPAALTNVIRTQQSLTPQNRQHLEALRLLLSAGAPVPAELLAAFRELMPNAVAHTPYGMTEVLPVANISLPEIEAAGSGPGVCVGHPVAGVRVAISAIDHQGLADGPLSDEPNVLGEICVSAAHGKDSYDKLWATEARSSRDPGWHRTGDVGSLDREGRLWVGGRLGHTITTAGGPVPPVPVERATEQLDEVSMAAAVGVGPTGGQVLVVVVALAGHRTERVGKLARSRSRSRSRVQRADLALSDRVRSVVDAPVAAVLVAAELPVDLRHNAKIDRAEVGRWADRFLSGR